MVEWKMGLGIINIRTTSLKRFIVVIPLAIFGFYLFSCLVLYAIERLIGWPTFSWLNGVWAMIILITLLAIFKKE